MAQRELLTVRVDPMVKRLIKSKAADLRGSDGYVIEMMASQVFTAQLPPGYVPGRRLIDGGEG